MSARRFDDEPQSIAVFQAVITASPTQAREPSPGWYDEEWAGMLEGQRGFLESALTRRAKSKLGPAFKVELGRPRIVGSVHVAVRLAVYYPVRITAATVESIRRFAGDVELTIAQALGPPPPAFPDVAVELDEESLPVLPKVAEAKSSWDRTAPILAAIATGIGVLGFVTFVGGAIEWARYGAAGVPQEEALAVTPTQDLVVVGAQALVPAIALGLAGIVLYVLVRTLLGKPEDRLPDLGDQSFVESHGDVLRGIYFAGFVLVILLVGFVVTVEDADAKQFLALLILGLLTVGLTYCIASRTERFVYLAATIFLSLSLFLGGLEYVREGSAPQVRGAAILQENKKAVIGFLIAESTNRVYLARIDLTTLQNTGDIDPNLSRLVGFDRGEVTDLAVGPPRDPRQAVAQARDIADELCRLQVPIAADEPAAGDKKPKQEADEVDCWSAPAGLEK